ncbi:MAG: sugar transferase [Lachnospiraceae bacterium]|jgi:exopolysaccharide biosynthesis polyprenyl glycosylphosphotransferase|nr:sugar transferase [Lachnospiraceae bacterium]
MGGNEYRYGKYKRLFRLGAKVWVMCYQAAVFWWIWLNFYNPRMDQPFALRGNWLILFVYIVVLWLFTNVYGGFQIGYEKPGSLSLSQSISVTCANAAMIFVMVLLSREQIQMYGKLASLVPLGVVTAAQIAGIILSAFVLNQFYDNVFPPRKLLVVYGEYQNSACELIAKMSERHEKYIISEVINQKEGYENILERIREYQGVVLMDVENPLRNKILKYCYGAAIRVYVVPTISDIILTSAENIHFFDTPLLLARNSGLSIEQKLIKRIMDLTISGLGIIITSPVMLITALAIKLYDGGPVFFRQDRATIGGSVFRITKFRSMVVDAEKNGISVPATQRDPRITPVGRFIRATRFDELPQLFDIFRGNMSIVGPRPERVEHVEKYTEAIPEFCYRLKVKGGLTGYAQIYGKYNTTAYDKLKLDLMYIENYSILLDIKLMLMTVKVIFMKESTEGFTEEKSAGMGKKREDG